MGDTSEPVVSHLLSVGIGGFLGSTLRYLVGGWVQAVSHRLGFPTGTLAVNLIGCLVIGLLAELSESRGPLSNPTRALVLVGILGGFTTFSAFGNETMNLWREERGLLAFFNVALHVVGGLAAVWLGRLLGEQIWR